VKVNKCGGCGLICHKFKGTDGVRICSNKKNPAPHDSIAYGGAGFFLLGLMRKPSVSFELMACKPTGTTK
jgi:hypothetical protein